MEMNLLGSGGVLPIPRPCCPCPLCTKARAAGFESWQTGPSLYAYGAQLLFDTPEDIRIQLNRENIQNVRHILWTHWHPDHTQGMRVIEQITKRRPETMPIDVYIAGEQLDMLIKYGCGNMLRYFEKEGLVRIHDFFHRQALQFDGLHVTPILIEKTRGYYFLLEDAQGKRCVYAPCEYHGLTVPELVRDVDVLITHCLWFEDPRIGHGVDFSDSEDSFEQMLEHAGQMNARKIVVMHMEESFGSTPEELNAAAKIAYPNHEIVFAREGMRISL